MSALSRVLALLMACSFVAGFLLAWWIGHDRTVWLVLSRLAWSLSS